MAYIRVFDTLKTGIDMSNWKNGYTAFSTAGAPVYTVTSVNWLDYNTVEAWGRTSGSATMTYVYMLADDWGSGLLLRNASYYNSAGNVSAVMKRVNIYVSYEDLNSGSTDWFGFALGTNDTIIGNNYRDVIKGAGGDDLLIGKGQSDRLFGEAGRDVLKGGSDVDVLYGGSASDTLRGGSGSDKLYGGGANDKLFGEKGNDILVGGAGDDILTGGFGRDIFQFARGSGSDRIKDFQNGIDHIRVGAGASRFKDLEITKSGDDTLVEFANVSILLDDTRPSQLDAGDFLF